MRFAIEKLTELGVSSITVGHTKRSGVKNFQSDKMKLWAESAVEQSGNPFIPIISKAERLDYDQFSICLDVNVSNSLNKMAPDYLAIGPEGGWDPSELSQFKTVYSLGFTTLRTETAAIVEDTGTTIPATLTTIDNFLDTEVAAILDDTNELQGDWANGGRLDLLLDSVISKIDVIDGIVDDILVDTAVIGVAGAGLTAVPWNAAWDTEVQSECNDALVALHLDHILAVDYDPASKPGVATALLNELIESDSGVSRFTANALETSPSGGGGGTGTAIAMALVFGSTYS